MTEHKGCRWSAWPCPPSDYSCLSAILEQRLLILLQQTNNPIDPGLLLSIRILRIRTSTVAAVNGIPKSLRNHPLRPVNAALPEPPLHLRQLQLCPLRLFFLPGQIEVVDVDAALPTRQYGSRNRSSSEVVSGQLTRGYKFATPVITPVPPTDKAGTSQSLCPASAQNSSGSNAALMRATLAMPPQVSLTPTMFGCLPSVASMSELRSRPATTPGKL